MLKEDYELTSSEVQELSGKAALAAFFARLGYNTNSRLVQSASAMGFSGDNPKAAINYIERLASQDNGFFEVYLFELKSVTVATTQALVRHFRDRPGDYLLVLTDDYSRLDFVLVERLSLEATRSQSGGTGPLGVKPQIRVRPRVLTVKRNNPDFIALRVLRRFSYTESDTFAQYDKLISAYDVAEWSRPFFNNRALFSDYYLAERLPQSAEWNDKAEISAMTKVYRTLRVLYADVRDDFSNQKEDVVRAKLLEPVLTALGYTWKVGKSASSDEIEPDYRLYSAATPNQTAAPLALGLAYTWNRNLDGKDATRDSETSDENPGAMVVSLLDKGEADWAIVTNGKIWRLYAAKAHSRATNYYEIDLEETLALPEASRAEAFRYFWLFFRAAAFTTTERLDGGEKRLACFLDNLLSESERYARELGERLKERVFEEIFPHFARGFIIYARRHQLLPANFDSLTGEERAKQLEPFFSGTLTFLYRLLFLLYAESRDLLPVREVRGYYEKSLEKLKHQIAEKAGPIEDQAPINIRAKYNDLNTSFYDALQELFQAVDRGDPALNVPVYNGGLFVTEPDPKDLSPEAETARFLSKYKIPDRELALGLDRMARDIDEKRHDLAFIDYKSLGVRQLGSIYEGLLEFKLRIASETLAVVKGKKTEELVPEVEARQKKLTILKEGRGKDAQDRTLPKGSVYLENDRRERKATGSYYTPDYIVKYIVENTVGPVLKEKLEALRPAFRQAEESLQAERKKYEALKKQGRTGGDSPENQAYLKHKDKVNEPFFDLKVLDPAMGSGHFLVEAVDYITDRMAKFLSQFRWNPVVHELTQTRRQIQGEMERQGVSVNAGKLTDINLLKRQVLKRCIYGVDLNPMAVELAKVSLWLDCFTLGAPLSFLDHHMKAGNSLIGGQVQEVQDALSRDLFGNQFAGLLSATSLMQEVGKLSDITVEQVSASRSTYRQAYDALAPFKRLLDVWISEHFANKGAQRTASLYAGAIVANDYGKTNPVDRKAIETALTLSNAKRFFHWELEFPEVFYNETQRKLDGGFDAVVGNPPYDVLTDLEERQVLIQEINYYNQSDIYKLATQGNINLYRLFLESIFRFVRENGFTGYIIPTSILADKSSSKIRDFMLTKRQLVIIESFPQKDDPRNRIFEGAKLSTCIIIFKNKLATDKFNIRTHPGKDLINSSPAILLSLEKIRAIDGINLAIPSADISEVSILAKMHNPKYTSPIGNFVSGSEGEFHKTKFKDYLTENPNDAVLYKGVQVGRYFFHSRLSQGKQEWVNEKGFLRASGNSERIKHAKAPRIVFQKLTGVDDSRRIYGMLVNPGSYLADSTKYIVSSSSYSLLYFLALYNAQLLEWRFRKTSTNNSVGVYELLSLPTRILNFTTPIQERAGLVEELKEMYREGLE
jgi:Alw26I/Eco31I/Esp3I family type II restriction m6 adenine DNA methyltransferase